MGDAGISNVEPRRKRIIELCRELPEVDVRDGQHVAFSVRKRNFAYYTDDHHGNGRIELHCKAPPGAQAELVDTEPDRYFVPPYLGSRGWVGLYLDLERVDWEEVEDLIREAYRLTAPKRLAVRLEGTG